jgi:hypothetical protein
VDADEDEYEDEDGYAYGADRTWWAVAYIHAQFFGRG